MHLNQNWQYLAWKAMKISFIQLMLIALCCGLAQANTMSAQELLDRTVSLRVKDQKLRHVLSSIEKQANVRFVYSPQTIGANSRVSMSLERKKLSEALSQLFSSQPVEWDIVGGQIILRRSAARPAAVVPGDLLLSGPVIVPESVDRSIRGRVTDENSGEALPGVSIMIKGTQKGTVTNGEGVYDLQVPEEEVVLVFSFVGYVTQEVEAGKRSAVDISMKVDEKALDEVVVTALGLKRKSKSLGYSVGEIDSEKLNLVPQENVLGGLSGKISGLDIRRSGNDLNAETYVYIRGRTSLAGNDGPLIIVDGAPVGGTDVMADISAQNIESVTVLKGASAAALYGSRAGNGVILITTKSGMGAKKGIGVTLNTNVTANKPYRFIKLQNRFTTGRKGIFNEADAGRWFGPEEGTPAVQWNTDGEEKPLKFYDNALQDYFKTGVTTISDVSVTGAYDRGSFQLSLSHMKGDGFSPGTELKRTGIGLSTVYKITDKVSISSNINIANPKSDNYPEVNQDGDDQYYDIYNIAPHVNINDLKDNYWVVKNVEQRKVTETFNNPWFSAYERKNRFDKVRGFGNIKLDWEITSELSAMARVSHTSTNNKSETLKPWSFDGFSGAARPKGSYFLNTTNIRESNADFLFSYNKKVGDFSIAPSVGGNLMSSSRSVMAAGGDNLVLPGLFTLSNVARGGLEYSSALFEKRIYSVYGVGTIGYKDLIFVDFSARNDWSSTLPAENRSYFYPSVSGSVMLSDMLNVPAWVSLIKLRTGWAKVGKDTDPYVIHPTLSQGYWGESFTYSLPGSMPNTNLKPEIATSYELGTDVSLFRNRLGFDVTFYKTQNRNQILNVGITPMAGYTSTTINAGNVENNGIELGLNAVPVRSAGLQWDLNMNFTRERSKLVELVDGIDRVSFGGGSGQYAFTDVGGTIGDLYSFDVMKVQEGEYKGWNILDANGRWKIQEDLSKLPKVGRFTNSFTMGLHTSLRYGRFTLTASFDWRHGGQFFSESMKRLTRDGKIEDWNNGISSSTFSGILGSNSFGGDRDRLAEEIKSNPVYRDNNVWIGGRTAELGGFGFAGNQNGAFFPGVIDNGDGTYTENFGGEGTKMFDSHRAFESSGSIWRTGYAFMYDASFIKLRDVNLSYQLPARVAGLLSAQKVSVAVYTKNIMLWTKAGINIDPELSYNEGAQGFEKWNTAPWTAPVGFNLNITF